MVWTVWLRENSVATKPLTSSPTVLLPTGEPVAFPLCGGSASQTQPFEWLQHPQCTHAWPTRTSKISCIDLRTPRPARAPQIPKK
eukprot:1385450-Amphidinium_carterae.1